MKRILRILSLSIFTFAAIAVGNNKDDAGNEAKEISAFTGTVLVSNGSAVYHANWCSNLIKTGKKVKRIKKKDISTKKVTTPCRLCYKPKPETLAKK